MDADQTAAHLENTFYAGANCIDAQKVLEPCEHCVRQAEGAREARSAGYFPDFSRMKCRDKG
jgi:hypothetical protein